MGHRAKSLEYLLRSAKRSGGDNLARMRPSIFCHTRESFVTPGRLCHTRQIFSHPAESSVGFVNPARTFREPTMNCSGTSQELFVNRWRCMRAKLSTINPTKNMGNPSKSNAKRNRYVFYETERYEKTGLRTIWEQRNAPQMCLYAKLRSAEWHRYPEPGNGDDFVGIFSEGFYQPEIDGKSLVRSSCTNGYQACHIRFRYEIVFCE